MKIVTAVVNNPIFIEIQHYTLKKYFKGSGSYEFIVFNDAKDFPDFTNDNDVSIKNKIEEMCNKLNIKCINIPNDHHINIIQASVRTSHSMNYILNYQKENPDKYLLFDSDMFLIDYFDVSKYFNYECAIVLQSRNENKINYFWNGLYYLDFTKIENVDLLNWDCCTHCDSGGMTQYWLEKQMLNFDMPNTDKIRYTTTNFHNEKTYFIKHLWSCSWNEDELPKNLKNNKKLIDFFINDVRNQNNKFFCEIYDDVFLHYREGGNWLKKGLKLNYEMTTKLKEILLE